MASYTDSLHFLFPKQFIFHTKNNANEQNVKDVKDSIFNKNLVALKIPTYQILFMLT